MPSVNRPAVPPESPSPLRAALWVLGSLIPGTMAVQTVLETPESFAVVGSPRLWQQIVSRLGARVVEPGSPVEASFGLILALLGGAAVGTWLLGAAAIGIARDWSWGESLAAWGRGWRWWMLPGAWEALRLAAFVSGARPLETFVLSSPHFWFAVALGGWLTTFLGLIRPATSAPADSSTASVTPSVWTRLTHRLQPSPLNTVVAAAVVYTIVFTAMNWQLFRGLLVPHGDSAMYEEHLWNLLHGKGFRSYLDQGLFLGEHIQVIHALLIPLYVLWPSHLLLELCESAALGSGAIATYFLARRHSGSERAATWLGLAYLLAVPMQFLDVAIDLKTFRPTAFAIPLLLFALDQMERRRWKTMLALLLVTLSAQEDLALVIAPLGVWMICQTPAVQNRIAGAIRSHSPTPTPPQALGASIAAGATAYLAVALLVLIPAFREGAEVHYTSYFGELGESPGEIARSLFTRPALVLGKLLSARSLRYALLLLLPYGLLPLRGWGRLLVAGPLFAVLCLMDTSADPNQAGPLLVPFHHFHAPLVPILVWAAAAGLAGINRGPAANPPADPSAATPDTARPAPLQRARFAACCALATGLFYSLSPAGIPFWDAGSTWHWRMLYVPGERAAMFPRVFRRIPTAARVASTDFIHPRFTHHERSYDYSGFRRRASGYEDRTPGDTDFIVIDTRHRYSTLRNPSDLRELRNEPDRWELLPDETDGYFIVLRRRRN